MCHYSPQHDGRMRRRLKSCLRSLTVWQSSKGSIHLHEALWQSMCARLVRGAVANTRVGRSSIGSRPRRIGSIQFCEATSSIVERLSSQQVSATSDLEVPNFVRRSHVGETGVKAALLDLERRRLVEAEQKRRGPDIPVFQLVLSTIARSTNGSEGGLCKLGLVLLSATNGTGRSSPSNNQPRS